MGKARNSRFLDAFLHHQGTADPAWGLDRRWKEFLELDEEGRTRCAELHKAESHVLESKVPYAPDQHLVLRFLTQSPEKIKAVLMGQDPYPSDSATGRAFEVKKTTCPGEVGRSPDLWGKVLGDGILHRPDM